MNTDKAEVLFHFKNIELLSICKTDGWYELDILLADSRKVCSSGRTIEDTFKNMMEGLGINDFSRQGR